MSLKNRVTILFFVTVGALLSDKLPPNPMPHNEIFPAPAGTVAAWDQAKLRAHGWDLFTLVWENVNAGHGFTPRWYTWCTDAEMYDSPQPVDCTGASSQDRELTAASRLSGLQPRSPDLPLLPDVLSQVYFSPALAKDLKALPAAFRPPVPLPPDVQSQHFQYQAAYLFSTLLDHNVHQLPGGANDEVVVKVAWSKLACPSQPNSAAPSLPAWDGKPPAAGEQHLDPADFPKVYIDPQTLARMGCTPATNVAQAKPLYKRDDFFWFQRLSDDPITALPARISQLNPGDYLFLTAMHIITHEQDKWVWATYWLSDPSDHAHMDDKPQCLRKGKGAHFAMDISINDKAPVFNPFLEGEQEGYEKSNCLRCHAAAAVFRTAKNQLTCTVPKLDAETPALPPGALQTGFLWTPARRATSNCNAKPDN